MNTNLSADDFGTKKSFGSTVRVKEGKTFKVELPKHEPLKKRDEKDHSKRDERNNESFWDY